MDEKKLGVFVDVTQKYFDKVSEINVKSGTPFLTNDVKEHLYEYTGEIPISGNHKGSVYFSTMALTAVRLLSDLKVPSLNPDNLLDLVGEISNTIAGNTRQKFGKEFVLQPPKLMHGKNDDMDLSDVADTYVIPLSSNQYRSNLIINLQPS